MRAAPRNISLDKLFVTPWPDPVIDRLGHDPCGEYVEQYWLGIIGPTATWLLRRLATRLSTSPQGFELDLRNCAGEVGVGFNGGRNSPFMKSIIRLCQYELTQVQQRKFLAVRTRIPTLPKRYLNRLPEHLQLQHARWERSQLQRA